MPRRGPSRRRRDALEEETKRASLEEPPAQGHDADHASVAGHVSGDDDIDSVAGDAARGRAVPRADPGAGASPSDTWAGTSHRSSLKKARRDSGGAWRGGDAGAGLPAAQPLLLEAPPGHGAPAGAGSEWASGSGSGAGLGRRHPPSPLGGQGALEYKRDAWEVDPDGGLPDPGWDARWGVGSRNVWAENGELEEDAALER